MRLHLLKLSLLTCTSLILLAQFVPVSHLLPERAQLPARSLLASSAYARPTIAQKSLFTLPVNSKPARSQGSGSRGCAQGDLAEVTLLIPSKTVVGQTASPRPTFLWKVSEPVSEPIKFTIGQPGEIEPLYETQIDATEAGIVAVQLPADGPELNPNQLYTWTVSLICNKKRPSANPFYASWIERIPMTPELEEELAAATADRDRGLIYAREGVWYDALALLHQARAENPSDPQIQADWLALLAEVGLQDVASQ